MIYGIGTDIVEVARVQSAWERHGERFARRILTPAEYTAFGGAKLPVYYLAKRFAAKEATVKALGTGFRGGIRLADIGVVHNAAGKPDLVCTGHAQRLMQRLNIGASHLSLADEREYAVAFVILLLKDAEISSAFA